MGLETLYKLSLVMSVTDYMTGPLASISTGVDKTVSKLDGMQKSFSNMTMVGSALSGLGAELVGAALAPVTATFDTRRALGELSSLGVEDLESLEAAARSFSDTWTGFSKADFISAAYDIKSGISSLSDEGIANMTTMAGVTAKATKASIGEMTSLFATGYGIYKGYYNELTDEEFGALFSAGISESVRAFKTSGSGMAQAIQSLGASATNANVPLEEQLAIVGMLQATMGGSEAGTKYNAFLRSAAKAGESLGLEFLDANKQLKSLPEILDILRGKFGDTIDAAEKIQLQKAFGDIQSVQFIDLLYNKTDDLQDNILSLYDAMGRGMDVATSMAEKINAMEPERWERLQQAGHNIMETIGNAMLPTINKLFDKAEEIIPKIGQWVEENQNLVSVVLTVIMVIGGLLTICGATTAVIGGIGLIVTKTAELFIGGLGAIHKLRSGFDAIQKSAMLASIRIDRGLGLVQTTVTKTAGAFKAFGLSLLTNPVTWIILGIVALVAGLVILYNKCEWFRKGINTAFGAIKDFLGPIFSIIGNGAKTTFANMKAAYEEHGGGFKGAVAAVWEGVKGIVSTGYGVLDHLTGGGLSRIVDATKNHMQDLRNVYEENGGGILGFASAMKFHSSKIGEVTRNIFADITASFQGHNDNIQALMDSAMGLLGESYEKAFTSLNVLSDGQLGAIRDIFSSKWGEITGLWVETFTKWDNITDGTFTRLLEAFSGGLGDTFALIGEWGTSLFESGKAAIMTLVDGMKSVISLPAETISGALAQVRNLLPFSDAKEGPLSTLTLSGQRTMSTLAEGMRAGQELPAQAAMEGMGQVSDAFTAPPLQKVSLREALREQRETETTTKETDSGIHIDHLEMPVDLNNLKDLPSLFRLLKELEGYVNAGAAVEGV